MKYGHISEWDVSRVTDMSGLFQVHECFNEDIDKWDVSNVTDMHHMFSGIQFNKPIGSWNVSNVKDMSYMFMNAGHFNQSAHGM